MQNRWALVTGADHGLGFALVQGLLERGWSVLAGQYQKDEEGLGKLQQEHGDGLRLLPLDLGDESSVKQALQVAAAVTDKLDILINNAAVLGDNKSTIQDELNFAEIERGLAVNALGPLRMSNALIGLIMNSASKLIVNISSEAGSIGDCYRISGFSYCMSKAALNMQSKMIHNRIAGQGGKVMVIHPGHLQTYMHGELDTKGDLTARESAEAILLLVEKRLSPGYEDTELSLVDYAGRTLPW
ncbi:MAG: short-chain dehydrogenase [Paenibacillaceae bacterium]|nr:short-chain dehydrogenase [Paenibacillaceae bacterium]